MNGRQLPDSYVAVDLETTGLSPEEDGILEIGAVKVEHGKVTDTFCTFVDPGRDILEKISRLTGITNAMVKGQKTPEEAFLQFCQFCGQADLMGHNLLFDYSFLKVQAVRQKLSFEKKGIDTLRIARGILQGNESKSLANLCACFQIDRTRAHRALDDALAAHYLYCCLKERSEEKQESLFDPRPLMYRPKKQSAITNSQKGYLKDLIKYHRIELEQELDSLTKSQASRLIDHIILNYGKIMR